VTEHPDDQDHVLSDRLLDLLVFAPAGAVVSFVEEFPKLAERGRDHLGVRISSARAVGEFVVTAGGQELRRRSSRLVGGGRGSPGPSKPPRGTEPATAVPTRGARSVASPGSPTRAASQPTPGSRANGASVSVPRTPSTAAPTPATTAVPDRHIPTVDALGIPGFDSLSASQVVPRLDGLNRQELVAVRAYETATRGRRTILSRVDQLLEARA
jgi:hypothetical protein